jgi:hypothetical protein
MYINPCYAMKWAALATTFLLSVFSPRRRQRSECVRVFTELKLIFFLGSGERERKGEQVLLTWALGSSAIKVYVCFGCLTLYVFYLFTQEECILLSLIQ